MKRKIKVKKITDKEKEKSEKTKERRNRLYNYARRNTTQVDDSRPVIRQKMFMLWLQRNIFLRFLKLSS